MAHGGTRRLTAGMGRTRQFPLVASAFAIWLQLSSVGCGASHDGSDGPPVDAATASQDAGTAARDVDATLPGADRERCNGRDDDLDGKVDEGCPIRLTTDRDNDVLPRLSGNQVAWLRQNPSFPTAPGRVMIRDLPDGEERVLLEQAYTFQFHRGRLAYFADGAYRVMDVRTGEELAHVAPQVGTSYGMRMHGDTLAWYELVEGTEEDYDVFSFDVPSNTVTRLTAERAVQETPEVEDGTVVWLDDRHGHHTQFLLHFYEFFAAPAGDGSAMRRVTTRPNEWAKLRPYVLNDGRILVNEMLEPWVAWAETKPCTTCLYDLATGERREILTDAAPCYTPNDMDGRRALLEFDPEGVSDLILLDLPSGEKRAITSYARRSTSGQIDGDLIVWADDRNDHWDLYMMDISDLDDGDYFPEGRLP